MKQSAATLALRYHAGLDQQASARTPSLADLLWRKEPPEEALDDVLRILEALNLEANGAVPSESATHEQCFPRALIYAVTEVIWLLREAANQAGNATATRDLNKAARRIELAWSAVLAGDIDNLTEHIAEEDASQESMA